MSQDRYLAQKGYREAIVLHINYILIFNVDGDKITIVGIFHQLENYQKNVVISALVEWLQILK